jgi:hypothetical protein
LAAGVAVWVCISATLSTDVIWFTDTIEVGFRGKAASVTDIICEARKVLAVSI